jgi:mTERF domain-containing protein
LFVSAKDDASGEVYDNVHSLSPTANTFDFAAQGIDDFSLDGLFEDDNEEVYDDMEYTEDEEADADFLDALFLEDLDQFGEKATNSAGESISSTNSSDIAISLDSLSSDLSYFYLRDELGLSEDVMWKITENAPSVLGFKAGTVRNKIDVLQSLLGLSTQDIQQVIAAQPTLLHMSAKKNISPKILFLQRQLQVSKKELRTLLLGCPNLLNYSRANLNTKIVHFFQGIMGLSLSETRRLLLKEPKVLEASVKTGLIPRLQFLHKEVQISLEDLRTMVKKNPRVLLMSVDQNLQPKLIFFFILTLRMEPKDISRLLVKYPQILNYNLDNHILPIYQYFTNTLDISTFEFAHILQRFPRLVTYSLTKMKQRLGYLRFELQLNPEAIRRILYQSPQVISLSQENLEATVQFLLDSVAPNATSQYNLERGDGLNEESLKIVQTVIAGMPSLLGLNIETSLKTKVDYFRSTMGQEALSKTLLKTPALLGYSLEKRIQPRMEQVLQGDVDPGKIAAALVLKEQDFQEWLKRRIVEAERERKAEEQQGRQAPQTGREMEAENEKINNDNEIFIESPSGKNKVVMKDGGRIMQWKRDTT